MFKVGDAIKWMCPLDNDYTYGEIIALRKSVATVKGTGLYSGITAVLQRYYSGGTPKIHRKANERRR